MSLDKAIASGKDRRKPYHKSARFDASCRPGGGCDYCENNRKHGVRKASAKADAKGAYDHGA